jgi:hypothetical protein
VVNAFWLAPMSSKSRVTSSAVLRSLGESVSTLQAAGASLVTQERASRNIIYRAAFDHMNAVLGYLTQNCCQGAECAVTAVSPACDC